MEEMQDKKYILVCRETLTCKQILGTVASLYMDQNSFLWPKKNEKYGKHDEEIKYSITTDQSVNSRKKGTLHISRYITNIKDAVNKIRHCSIAHYAIDCGRY